MKVAGEQSPSNFKKARYTAYHHRQRFCGGPPILVLGACALSMSELTRFCPISFRSSSGATAEQLLKEIGQNAPQRTTIDSIFVGTT